MKVLIASEDHVAGLLPRPTKAIAANAILISTVANIVTKKGISRLQCCESSPSVVHIHAE